MSEIRQRKGNQAPDAKDAEIAKLKAQLAAAQGDKVETTQVVKQEDDEANREELVRQIQERLIQSVKKEVKPGLSNEAFKAKAELQKDPFNMASILELGRAYAADEQWEQSINVLMRGWKRVQEIPNHEVRLEFLTILDQGCVKTKKYKQALAVLNDIEEPADEMALRGFLVMSCQVYSFNGDMARALKAFNRAIEDDSDFDGMLGVWVGCMPGLKKVGAFDAARSSLEMKIKTDEQRSKLETYEKLAGIRQQLADAVEEQPMSGNRKVMLMLILIVILVINAVFLYKLETWSLSKMIKPDSK